MSFNVTWSRRWRRRDATSRRWRLHEHTRVHASRGNVATVRATQDKVFSDVVEKLHKHVHPKTKKPASLIADDVYEVIMYVSRRPRITPKIRKKTTGRLLSWRRRASTSRVTRNRRHHAKPPQVEQGQDQRGDRLRPRLRVRLLRLQDPGTILPHEVRRRDRRAAAAHDHEGRHWYSWTRCRCCYRNLRAHVPEVLHARDADALQRGHAAAPAVVVLLTGDEGRQHRGHLRHVEAVRDTASSVNLTPSTRVGSIRRGRGWSLVQI